MGYFLALLIMSSGWRGAADTYWVRQTAMACSLFAAILVGSTFAIPAMLNIACTFLVLFLMEKELEEVGRFSGGRSLPELRGSVHSVPLASPPPRIHRLAV